MKRDLEYLRSILKAIEAAPTGNQVMANTLDPAPYTGAELYEHLRLLNDAGFIEARFLPEVEGERALPATRIYRLTWSGHDYLAAVGDDKVWAKTKERLGPKLVSVSLEVVKSVAVAVMKHQLGLP